MNFTLIMDSDESLRAFKAFESAFTADTSVISDCSLGMATGSVPADIHWHEKTQIWGVFRKKPPRVQCGRENRFWNCFGVWKDYELRGYNKLLNIAVQINPPYQKENRRTGGVFLFDDKGRYYVGHSGKIGGGRRGVGRHLFRQYSDHLLWQNITTPRGKREIVVFGPLEEEKSLPDMLAPFIHTVSRFKSEVQFLRKNFNRNEIWNYEILP